MCTRSHRDKRILHWNWIVMYTYLLFFRNKKLTRLRPSLSFSYRVSSAGSHSHAVHSFCEWLILPNTHTELSCQTTPKPRNFNKTEKLNILKPLAICTTICVYILYVEWADELCRSAQDNRFARNIKKKQGNRNHPTNFIYWRQKKTTTALQRCVYIL